ncbi:MAG: response regulator transcription factor [Actinomycetia bacterium]|nr:response regulator transcription factor [Actinomycetes bacterium]
MMARQTIVLVDDHDILRAGSAKFLADRFEIVGEASDVGEAIKVILDTEPDGVLLDVRMPSGTGDAVVAAVRESGSSARFLVLSVSAERDDVVRMLNAGVDGYLLKSTLGEQLGDLVAEMLDGGRPISPQIAGFMLDIDDAVDTGTDIESLTPREREVVQYIARGYSYRKTAEELFVSVKTVETHMGHIFDKLGIASRYELAMKAFESGMLSDDA